MIQITPQHHIFVHIEPLDLRKGIDALVGFCQSKLSQSPFSGTIFVFRNTKGTAVTRLSSFLTWSLEATNIRQGNKAGGGG